MDEKTMVARLKASGNFQVIEHFTGRLSREVPASGQVPAGLALALDTETTGLSRDTDKIIELGLVLVEYSPADGSIVRVVERYNALEDPGFHIPSESTKVNGITDEMVAGHRIEDDRVASLVAKADFVIAHNAGFDRCFCEKRLPVLKDKPWLCSLKQVDWSAEGIGSAKLDYIAYRQGFFYEAHRAEMDCLAMLEALSRTLPVSGTTAFEQLMKSGFSDEIRVWALGAPFETKEILAKRGYRWGPSSQLDKAEKAWFTLVDRSKYIAELEWLHHNVYAHRPFALAADNVTPFNRFSARRGEIRQCYYGKLEPSSC